MPRPPPAGSSLLETLIALLVINLGLLALGRLQTRFWAALEGARQQGEALQLAQAEIDTLRHQLATEPSAWASFSSHPETSASLPGSATAYLHSSTVSSLGTPALKSLNPALRWQDREGAWHLLGLNTLLNSHDRRLSAWLALAPDAQGPAAPQGRHWAVPSEARLLSDGRHAFKPRADLAEAWVFEPTSGRIVARCAAPVDVSNSSLSASDLSACTPLDARLLAGWVSYTGLGTTLAASDAEQPSGPVLPVGLQLSLSSTGHPSPAWACVSGSPDEPHPNGALPYWCLVQPAGSPLAWSGRLDLVPTGWRLAGAPDAGPDARRVCRYSADHNHNGQIDNLEHPAAYSGVQGPLPQQNFLVIAAGATCPLDGPPQHSLGGVYNAVDDSTVAHQP